MSNDLVEVQRIIEPLAPRFEDVLKGTGLPAARLMQTFYFACESNPRLLKPEFRASLPRACMSFGVLGIEVDGVTGQGFIVPFGGAKPVAQPLLGYKGYPTIGARSGVSFQMGLYREGDEFDYQMGTGGYVKHKPALGKEKDRKILAAWSVAEHRDRPSVPIVLSLDECLAVKAKSQGAKKPDSPWNDMHGPGFGAMCMKTALRRVGKLIPVRGIQIASRMEEAYEEQGRSSFVDPDHGLIIDGEAQEMPKQEPETLTHAAPTFDVIDANGVAHSAPTIDQWRANMLQVIDRVKGDKGRLEDFAKRHEPVMARLAEGFYGDVQFVEQAIDLARDKH